MIGAKCVGMLCIVPAALLLVVSFFVLVVAGKVKEQVLKSFGNIVAMLLWVAAALVFLTGIYITATGNCPVLRMMEKSGKGGKYYKMMECKSMDRGVYHKGMMRK